MIQVDAIATETLNPLIAFADEEYPSPTTSAYLCDFVIGILTSVQTICDCWLTYSRYAVIHNHEVSTTFKCLVGLYVVLLEIMPWLLFYTVVPFFADVNSMSVSSVQTSIFNFLYIPMYLFFNAYFTAEFVIAVRRLTMESVVNRKLVSIAAKSIVHTVVRCASSFSSSSQSSHTLTSVAITLHFLLLLTARARGYCMGGHRW